jgi:hypothetical protein
MSLVRLTRQQDAGMDFEQLARNDHQESDDEEVPHYWQTYRSSESDDESKYETWSKKQLQAACNDAGLKVLIDMHPSSSHVYATTKMISYCR